MWILFFQFKQGIVYFELTDISFLMFVHWSCDSRATWTTSRCCFVNQDIIFPWTTISPSVQHFPKAGLWLTQRLWKATMLQYILSWNKDRKTHKVTARVDHLASKPALPFAKITTFHLSSIFLTNPISLDSQKIHKSINLWFELISALTKPPWTTKAKNS